MRKVICIFCSVALLASCITTKVAHETAERERLERKAARQHRREK